MCGGVELVECPACVVSKGVLYILTCSSSLDSVQDGVTALHVASQEGHCGVVKKLLKAKADIKTKDNVSESSSSDCV